MRSTEWLPASHSVPGRFAPGTESAAGSHSVIADVEMAWKHQAVPCEVADIVEASPQEVFTFMSSDALILKRDAGAAREAYFPFPNRVRPSAF
jgi:hypothetical protein